MKEMNKLVVLYDKIVHYFFTLFALVHVMLGSNINTIRKIKSQNDKKSKSQQKAYICIQKIRKKCLIRFY